MKAAIFSLVLFLGITSQAQTTPHDELQSLFEAGSTPTQEDVAGWWSGRCFYSQEPTKATAALLLAETVTSIDNSKGPLFPNPTPEQNSFNMAIFAPGHLPPADRYDTLTSHDRDLTLSFLRSDKFRTQMIAQTLDGSMTSKNQSANVLFSVRKNGPYFISALSLIEAEKQTPAGTTIAHCYFFKNVTAR